MASSSNECNEAEIDIEKFREDFCDTISVLSGCMRYREYEQVVKKITSPNYKGDEKFDVTHKRGKVYLIDKNSKLNAQKRKYLSVEDMFKIILEAHVDVGVNGHLDLIQMRELISYTHPNFMIPTEAIDWIANNCKICKPQNSAFIKTGHKHVFDRNKYVHYKVLVSICNMSNESVADSPFKYLLIYKDIGHIRSHSFVLLRPLIDDSHFEVASELAKIFFSFGPPKKILVNDGDGEYFNLVKRNLNKLCGECDVIIEVCSERASAKSDKYVVEKILQWETEMGSSEWALGCHIVQWQINQIRIKLESPYERMFSVSCEPSKRQKKSTTSQKTHLDIDKPPLTVAKSEVENKVASQDDASGRDSNLINVDEAIELLESTEDEEEEDQNQHQHVPKVLSTDRHDTKTATSSNCIADEISSFHIPNQHLQQVQNDLPSDRHDAEAITSNSIETAIQADDCTIIVKEESDDLHDDCTIIVKEESDDLHLNSKQTAELVRSICDDFNIVLHPSNEPTAAGDQEVKEQQNNNYENKKACKVCQTIILKYFVCARCKEYVHLYCAVQRRTPKESQLICFFCASL